MTGSLHNLTLQIMPLPGIEQLSSICIENLLFELIERSTYFTKKRALTSYLNIRMQFKKGSSKCEQLSGPSNENIR